MLISNKFFSDTTIHGLNNAASTSNHIVRLIWIILIGLSTYVCGYTAYSAVVGYLEYDVITVTQTVDETSVVFPSLTVCAPISRGIKLNDGQINLCKFEEAACNATNDLDFFSREVILNSKNKEKMFCIRHNGFHKNNTLKTKTDIESKGLILKWTMNENFSFYLQDNYLNTYKSSVQYLIGTNETFRVYASKTVSKRLGDPYNPCKEVGDETYRRDNCLEMCVHEQVLHNFKCSLRSGYYYKYSPPRVLFCNQNDTVQAGWNVEYRKQCEVGCPKECSLTNWNVDIVPGPFHSDLKVPLTTVEVYITQMSHLELSQIPKSSFWDFLSSLGGTLGFLGMSFLSFVEVAEFILQIIFSVCL